MKKLNMLLGLLIGLTILSCSPDDNSNDIPKTEKKLVRVTYKDLNNNQNQEVNNYVYDSKGNIVEINDQSGLIIVSYTYNSSNRLIQQEYFEYDNQTNTLYFKEIDNLSYNTDNKISNIENINVFYNSDGSISSQNSKNNTITYSSNSITKISDNQIKVEYGLNDNDLITSIKVYRNNILKSDMSFTYDSNGNCISGTGSIDEGSLDSTTDNIALNVTYGIEEKNPLFNNFFDYKILTFTSFYNLRQVLINQQGNSYPTMIQWYKYSNYSYKEVYDNSFDNNGFLISKSLSEFPDYPNYGMITLTWE